MGQFSNQIGGSVPKVPWGQTSSERIPLFSDPPFLIKSTFVLDWSNLNTLVVLRFFDDLFQIHRDKNGFCSAAILLFPLYNVLVKANICFMGER